MPHSLFQCGEPLFVTGSADLAEGVAEAMGTSAAVLIPLKRAGSPLGVLAIAVSNVPSPDQLRDVASVGNAFTIALEQLRANREAELQRRMRTLLQDFSKTVSSSTLSAGLTSLCVQVNGLFGAMRTSVWLHERRARELVLSASSDARDRVHEPRIPTSDRVAPAAIGLRLEHAAFAPHPGDSDAATGTLSIPLRGRRRALGTMVIDGIRLDRGRAMTLDRAEEIGGQLSAAIENLLLFDAVLRSRRELENTFNSLADLVAVIDRDGRITYANRAFSERIGKDTDGLMNRPLSEVVGEATRAILEKSRGGMNGSVELHDSQLRGTFIVTLEPLLGGDHEPTGHVFVARDITAHAQLQAERGELRNRLVQSDKLAALGQFIAGIAHELNNPLQGVLGHIELLRATGAFPKGLRRDIQRIYREADRAAKIVRNLLVFAGSRRLVRKRTSVNAIISRVLALRAPAFRAADIEIVRRHEEQLPRVSADPLLLHQALLNIVLNAEQAIGVAGGRIETRTSLHEDDSATYVRVQVRDTGPGIPASALPRLFEPFYTTKEVGKGTGLGLAITYGIVQDHGGHIAAENHPDGGAVFTVQLPAENG